jgi:small subunit ribosomal protein S4
MSRYRNARIRVIRRLGPLPGLTKKMTTRTRYPGEHDKKPGASSDYAIRLEEKQKLRYNYGISERQLYNYLKKARRMNGSTGILLLQLLEMRLDNIIFRLGLGSTIPESRQLVNHGHILVNDQVVTIPSFQCKKGDTIKVKVKSRNRIKTMLNSPFLPKFLEFDSENLQGQVKNLIERQQVGLNINELLVVEYYSRK